MKRFIEGCKDLAWYDWVAIAVVIGILLYATYEGAVSKPACDALGGTYATPLFSLEPRGCFIGEKI